VCSPAAAAVALRDLASAMSESSAFREGITLRWVRISANCAFGVNFFVSFCFCGGGIWQCARKENNPLYKALRAFP
jgi:hypothetical protein